MKKEAVLITFLITFLLILMSIVFAQENQNAEMIKEQIKCIFLGSNTEQKCYGENFVCAGSENCIVDVSGAQGKTLTWKSTCGGYAETVIDGQNEEISFKCEQQPQPVPEQTVPLTQPLVQPSTQPRTQFPAAQPPNQKCIDSDGNYGACVKGEKIIDQITCIFVNSDREQQCYIAGSFTGEDEGKKFCRGKENCIINYEGNKGEQITWKSTCGGYQYTAQDGNKKDIKFECKTGEAKPEEIKNRGFRFAYWQCYDGSESKSEDTTSCKTSETWQKYAAEFCTGKCYADKSKCGVNSFSISNECYTIPVPVSAVPVPSVPAVMPAIPTTIPAVPTEPVAVPNAKTTAPSQNILYYFRDDNCPHCQDMDKEISILKQRGFFDKFNAIVYNIKEEGISKKFEIRAVPAFILYKENCMFRKEGVIKSDELEKWIYESNCEKGEKNEDGNGADKTIAEPATETGPSAQPILICKDSCPSDGKCYPFGYRKAGMFCLDEGKFVEQLKEDGACENNFECASNVCVDGKCMSSGLIQKIISLFRNIFGIS